MTFSLVGTPTNPGLQGTLQGASTTFSLTTTPTTGNFIAIPLVCFAAGLCQSVTVGGQSATRITTATYDSGNFIATEFWYILNYSGSGNSVVITYFNSAGGGGAGNFPLTTVLEFGSAGSVTLDQVPTSTTGASTAPAITSGTTTSASELVMAVVADLTGNTTITNPTGYTQIFNDGNWTTDTAGQAAYKIIAATGTQTATWGYSPSQTYRAVMATFKDAVSVTPSTPLRTQQRAPGFPPGAPLPGIARVGLGILAGVVAPQSSTSGTGSAALSSFAISATGAVTFDAPGSAAISSFAAAGNGVFAIPAPVASPQPQAFGAPARFSAKLPAPPPLLLGSGFLVPSVVATPSFTGTGSAAFSPFAVTASGLITFDGAGSAATSSFVASASGAETFAATATAAMSPFASSGAGAETFASTVSAATSPFASSGSGAEAFTGTASASPSSFASSGSGIEQFDGSGSAALSSFTIALSGVFAIPGPMAQSQPRAVGFPSRFGVPAGLLGRGLLVAPPAPIPNTGTAAVSPFAVAASGLVTFTATSSAAISSFALSASALETFAASAAATTSPFAATSSSLETFTGTGSAASQPFGSTGSGTSVSGFGGSATSALSPFASSAAGAESFTGSAAAALSPFACTASGANLNGIAGGATATLSTFASSGSGTSILPITSSGSASLQPFACTGRQNIAFVCSPVPGRNSVTAFQDPDLRASPVFTIT